MKLKEIIGILDAKVLTKNCDENTEILSGCGSDLMSDVLAFVKDQGMLLTGLVNPQVIRTCEMMDMKVVVFVRGKKPNEDVLNLASDSGICVLSTDYPMYIACGKLYKEGLYNW